MSIPYFPGCTLNTKAVGYDHSGRAVAAALGMDLQEIDDWQCCGATFPLATDNSLALIAPTRVLRQAEQTGDTMTTLCAICYHVLKRTQVTLDRDPAILERINWFTENPYQGQVRVTHFLEMLRDDLTWEGLRAKVQRPLAGLKVAPYYGCLLLRPEKEIGLDNSERPTILGDCLEALGAEVIEFPYAVECCGSYLALEKAEIPNRLSNTILQSARKHGADILVTACPLCQFNLDYPQRQQPDQGLPILYFTQLMAVALGLPEEDWGLQDHYVKPTALLKEVER